MTRGRKNASKTAEPPDSVDGVVAALIDATKALPVTDRERLIRHIHALATMPAAKRRAIFTLTGP